MPIYAYKCGSCGHAKDVLQKLSDAPLTECPACGVSAFSKQVTAAGFQLKGSGWYATDFRGSGAAPAPAAEDGKTADAAKSPDAVKTSDTSKTADGSKSVEKPSEGTAKPAVTSAPAKKPDAPAAAGGACAN
jgi:putative FmdB family regulatory protein